MWFSKMTVFREKKPFDICKKNVINSGEKYEIAKMLQLKKALKYFKYVQSS